MRKILALLTVFVLSFLLTPLSQFALAGFEKFKDSGDYQTGQFSDVDKNQWFARYVEDAFNYGLISGKGADVFDPGGTLTLGEALKLVVRLCSIYDTGEADFVELKPFHLVYTQYAIENGILEEPGDYTAPVSRAQFAQLICNALPTQTLSIINDIPDYAICDVVMGDSYYDDVYSLYRAGIMTGCDRYGTFRPNSSMTRAEACTVLVRLINQDYRVRFVPPMQLPAEVIYNKCADAVFMLETFDEDGQQIRTGTGFFVSGTGYAITNLHVLGDAVSATATLISGEVFDVLGAYAVSEEFNLVAISIGTGDANVSNRNSLYLADSDLIEVGNTVYALGNPMDLANSITEGIISNKFREVDGETLIQFSAPISFGSGGSPVLNSRGQVIGVASSSFSYGQNMNLAVPINHVKTLEIAELISLDELLIRELD